MSEPRTVITIAVSKDGIPAMRVTGDGSVSDLILASGVLQLETSHAFEALKFAQAADRSRIVAAPAIPHLQNGKG